MHSPETKIPVPLLSSPRRQPIGPILPGDPSLPLPPKHEMATEGPPQPQTFVRVIW